MATKHTGASTAGVEQAAGSLDPPPTTPAAPVGAPAEIAVPAGAPATPPRPVSSGRIESLGETAAVTVRTVRGLLPSRLPVFLATSALLVAGLIDPPVALGAGLALEAFRRWEPVAPR